MLIRLPAILEFAAQARVKTISDRKFRREARKLLSIIYNLKLPHDESTIKSMRADIKTELEIRDKIDNLARYDPTEFHLSEQTDQAQRKLHEIIEGKLEERRRDWHYYEYDDYASVLYLATRLAPNYSCLKKVMNEIKAYDPEYEPKSVMDYGSGMGTTIWAVNETWPSVVKEFQNIEISSSQQRLCEFLLRRGKEFGDPLTNIYHRQYLPSSTRTKYDMVVAAYSMLELPNSVMRAQVIENLWNKTNDLLVIIERGNSAGFQIVNEARNFVLDLAGHEVTRRFDFSHQTKPKPNRRLPQAHVVAPCSHEFACPKVNYSSKESRNICRFRVKFEPLEIGQRKGAYTAEDFSYVVIRKGPHPSYTSVDCLRCPRVVEAKKKASRHITHQLCCPDGNLTKTVITKRRHGKPAYESAKSCDWGDTIPIKVHNIM